MVYKQMQMVLISKLTIIRLSRLYSILGVHYFVRNEAS